jgi:uncharacterized YccA/Bax inhibitor family protein
MAGNANPLFSDKNLSVGYAGEQMTVQGTVNKTMMLTLLVMVVGYMSWQMIPAELMGGAVVVSAIAGLVIGLIGMFNKKNAMIWGLLYAVAEGVFLGIISGMFNQVAGGIVVQAFLATMIVLFTMLLAYQRGWIQVTQRFKTVVFAATMAVFVFYLFSFVLSMFGSPVSILNDASPLSIGLSIVIIIIAAMNLAIDFQQIDSAVDAGAPKYMEWYCAFGLLVTLVWLYIEILRLLYKLRRE